MRDDVQGCDPLKRRADKAGKLASQAEAVADALEAAITTTGGPVQSASGKKDKGGTTVLVVVIIMVVLVIVAAVVIVAVVLKRKNGAEAARTSDMVSFENPMYASTGPQTTPETPSSSGFAQPTALYDNIDEGAVNSGSAGYTDIPAATGAVNSGSAGYTDPNSGSAGYTDIPAATGTPAGYMDVSPHYVEPEVFGAGGAGYMDVAPQPKGGYMDVAPSQIEGDFSDEEDV